MAACIGARGCGAGAALIGGLAVRAAWIWGDARRLECIGHPKKRRSRRHKPSASSLRAGEGTRTLDVHLGNRLAFDLDWPSCIPTAVESTEVVLFVPRVSPYFRTRYGSCGGIVLLKWGGFGLMRFIRFMPDTCYGHGPQTLSRMPRSAPSTRPLESKS